MASKQEVAADLRAALAGAQPLDIDLYVEVLADHEDALKASLDKDADDALLCMLADEGDVAMLVIEWDGSLYRNDNALKKLRAMWRQNFDANIETLVPIFSEHIVQKNLGVAGIKWRKQEALLRESPTSVLKSRFVGVSEAVSVPTHGIKSRSFETISTGPSGTFRDVLPRSGRV